MSQIVSYFMIKQIIGLSDDYSLLFLPFKSFFSNDLYYNNFNFNNKWKENVAVSNNFLPKKALLKKDKSVEFQLWIKLRKETK